MTRAAAPMLCALAVAGCYASHGRAVDPPALLDAGVARDARGARDDASDGAARRDDAGDASDDGSVVPWPEVPDAGLAPGLEADFYDFCASYFALRCEFDQRCCWPGRRSDPDACATGGFLSCATMAATITRLADRYIWDADAADALLRRLRAAGATCSEFPAEAGFLGFRQVVVGRIPRSGDCTPPAIAPYDAWVDYTCQPGLRCALSGSATTFRGVCTDAGADGEPCGLGSWAPHCDGDYYCARHYDPMRASPGVCTPRSPDGFPCRVDAECASWYCADARDRCEAAPVGAEWCLIFGGG